MPIVGTFAPLTARMGRYGYKAFTLWNIVGALGWATSVILLGSWLGHYEIIAKNIDVIAVVMVLGSVLPWGFQFLKQRRRRRRAGAKATADCADETSQDTANCVPAGETPAEKYPA